MKRVATVSRHLLAPGCCAAQGPQLPGKLGNPEHKAATDPRLDPAIARIMQKYPPAPMAGSTATKDKTFEEQVQMALKFEKNMDKMTNAKGAQPLPAMLAQVETMDFSIQGPNGEVKLQMTRPKGSGNTALPCLYHMHGGGMAVGSAFDASFRNHRTVLAAKGICCIGVEFRNSVGGMVYGPDAPRHPFPIGVNDCMAGLEHIAGNKEKYKISTIVLNGESGGGNLCIALALLAKRQGKIQMVDGVYANCPMIAGDYAEYSPTYESLPSLWENTESRSSNPGKLTGMGKLFVDIYTPPGSKDREDCVAWPLKATEEDLKGLPPHVISVNELDSLRDEGLEYYRKLRKAGVVARGIVSVGTDHAGDVAGNAAFHKFAMQGTRDAIVEFVKNPKPEF